MARDESLIREGDAWVVLMTSGMATRADADAVRRWRERSPAHEAAFREAVRLRQGVREAGAELRRDQAGSAAGPINAVSSVMPSRSPSFSRRALLKTAMAASATGVAIYMGGRMGGLWPGAAAANFTTGKGQRLTVALGDGLSAELNTLTRLSRRPEVAAHGVELLSGEAILSAAVTSEHPLVAVAGAGRTIAHQARFSLRCDEGEVVVTCLSGTVSVTAGANQRELSPDQRLSYGRDGMSEPVAIDPMIVTAWRQGILVFRKQPLSAVVEEINRYRPGRIVIADRELARRNIDGTFYVAQLDQFFDQVRSAFGANITRLPGDVVVLT